MRTADTDQLHPFWMTLWNFITDFRYVLAEEEVQKAITSLNKPKKHPFWDKFKEALLTLVKVPKEIRSVRFHTKGDIPECSTRDWLGQQTRLNIPEELRKEFRQGNQRMTPGGMNCVRSTYAAEDFNLLGKISRMFPGHTETIFDSRVCSYTLPMIERFMNEADLEDTELAGRAIIEPGAENVFLVCGHDGFVVVSVRKKLGDWRMRRVCAEDYLRGPNVYVFS
jgi:hypothetical protein